MKVKMILPALTEAKSPFWRPIKYSLFPPLGLATLAGYLNDDDQITIDSLTFTEMACLEPDGVMAQEEQFLDALESAASWSIQGTTLTLRVDDGATAAACEPGE